MPLNMQNIFKDFAPQMKTPQQKDSSLASILISLDEQEALKSDLHLKGYQAPMESHPGGIKSLVYTFQMTLSSQPQEGMGAYNEQTLWQGHPQVQSY